MSNIFNLLFWNNKSVFYNLQIGFNKRILERFWFFTSNIQSHLLSPSPENKAFCFGSSKFSFSGVKPSSPRQRNSSGGYRTESESEADTTVEEEHDIHFQVGERKIKLVLKKYLTRTLFLNLFFVSNLYDPNLEQTIF